MRAPAAYALNPDPWLLKEKWRCGGCERGGGRREGREGAHGSQRPTSYGVNPSQMHEEPAAEAERR